ncbi:hypothetical protein [Sphingomonas sanguinis]|uniref:hypothetical protein n=1 Tax=Sphingomonas sanguinis TaxID=33051 RepID=UPI00128F4455|nr:hypothetical protein [Sphingomonas sanguinis]
MSIVIPFALFLAGYMEEGGEWNDRNEVYFRGVVIDVARSGVNIDGKVIPLFDCSTPTMRCFQSEIFELKVPVRCGGEKELKALGNVVLGSRPASPESHHAIRVDGGKVFYIQNPAYPGFVWEYDYSYGVLKILYDRKVVEGKPPTIAFARLMGSSAYRYGYPKVADLVWGYKLSFDPFGACDAAP